MLIIDEDFVIKWIKMNNYFRTRFRNNVSCIPKIKRTLLHDIDWEIHWFRHFWGRQPVDADCVMSIEYNSELLIHVSTYWEVLTRRKYTDNLGFSIWLIIGPISPYKDFQFFDTWFINSEVNSIDVTQSASAGCRPYTKIRNQKISTRYRVAQKRLPLCYSSTC